MSLIIKQRFFSLTDAYDICDHTGRPRYSVWTEFLTLGHHIHVVDTETGGEVGQIKERIFTFFQRADIYANGVPFEVKREFTFFRPRYTLSNGWKIKGDFMGWDYEITDSFGQTVATVSKELLHFTDTYLLDVAEPEFELSALLAAITIDMMNCSN